MRIVKRASRMSRRAIVVGAGGWLLRVWVLGGSVAESVSAGAL